MKKHTISDGKYSFFTSQLHNFLCVSQNIYQLHNFCLIHVSLFWTGKHFNSNVEFPFKYFSAMVSYNVIVGDTITRVFARILGYDILWARDLVTLTTSLCLTLPISLYRSVNVSKEKGFPFHCANFVLGILASLLGQALSAFSWLFSSFYLFLYGCLITSLWCKYDLIEIL